MVLLLVCAHVFANEPSTERQAVLINMLKHDCGACHGLTLKGGLGPPLLADALTDKSAAMLVEVIREGRKNTAMPPWKRFISEQETWWLVNSILRKK